MDPKEIAFLKTIMGEKAFVTYLLFRGSRDGWNGKDFHLRCDGKGATISLYRINRDGFFSKKSECIGGFTNA